MIAGLRPKITNSLHRLWPGAKAPGHNLYKLFVIFGRSPAIIKDRLLIQSPSSFIYDTFVIHLYQLDDVII